MGLILHSCHWLLNKLDFAFILSLTHIPLFLLLFSMTNSQVAVITGGSRGIGHAIASALVKRNINVVIGDLLDKEGQAAVDAFNKR